jgi:hemoglobin
MDAALSLYARAGGSDAFVRLTDAFYARVVRDDLLAPLFARMDPDHARYVAVWPAEVFGGSAEVFGGPAEYTEKQNSQPGADVVGDVPVPRWGWGVAPPYLG